MSDLALTACIVTYFLLPWFLLRRGWIIRAGLAMLAVALAGMSFLAATDVGLGAGALPFLLLPLPLFLVLVGLAVAMTDSKKARRVSK